MTTRSAWGVLVSSLATLLVGGLAAFGNMPAPSGGVLLRVMTWNIAEGSKDRTLGRNAALARLAEEIRARNPDVVLLNEVRNENGSPFGDGVNQIVRLSQMVGLPHRHWANVNALGWVGHKVVGVLSRYPLESAVLHPVRIEGQTTGFGTLETSLIVNDHRIRVFSTRFSPVHWGNPKFDYQRELRENTAGIQQATDMLRARDDQSESLIFGGDLNTSAASVGAAHYLNFVAHSGLVNAISETPDPFDGGVDYIFYRGPFAVTLRERREPNENPSDHPYVLAEFQSPPTGFAVEYGGVFKLRHESTNRVLHSHAFSYGHAASSGQQQVTGFTSSDDNDWWRIKGPREQPEGYMAGRAIRHGAIVRLEHVSTQCNLHSHNGHPSPVTHQQEVTCYSDYGGGDANDNWRVEVDGGGAWLPGRRVKLIHVSTQHVLHSHLGYSHPEWTRGQQEVTAYEFRDDNDWWSVFASR